MSQIMKPIFFLSMFMLIFASMHYYIYFRLSTLFPQISWGVIIIMLFWILFSGMIISRSYYNKVIQIYYTIAVSWLGIAFLLISVLFVYEMMFRWIPIPNSIWQIIIPTTVILASTYALIYGQRVVEKEITIPLEKLQHPLRVIQLSDIHVGTVHNEKYFHTIVEKVNKQKPDIVFITGDLFDGSGLIDEHVIEPLNEIKAKTFFVMGNHEVYEGIEIVQNVVNKTKVTILRDTAVEYKGIQIIGMDDPESHHSLSGPDLTKIKIAKDKPSILLYHQPSGLRNTANAGIDLQLSGHTHNGQIFPFTLLVKLVYPVIKGLYYIDYTNERNITKTMALYVSQGTGTWGPPMRLGSNNEITIINLISGNTPKN